MSAISVMDQALSNIKGKRLGVPVYGLVREPTRRRIRLYTHVGGTTPETTADHALRRVADGFFTALKLAYQATAPGVASERYCALRSRGSRRSRRRG